jgi:antitoxin (DNA-binding transcriptional repressor) of toxin-antitoxin stability system
MNQISKSQFKAKALEMFRAVETSGEPLIITDNGKPTLEIRPYAPPTTAEILETLRGTVLSYDNPFEPVGLEDWDVLK